MGRPSGETCWTLLRAAADGDDEARAAFSGTYLTAIRGYLSSRWRGRAFLSELDDAVQEVFVECFKPNGALERADPDGGGFRGLLCAVTRNVARRCEERLVQRGGVSPEDTAWLAKVSSDEDGQETLFDRSWARALVHEATGLHRERALLEGGPGDRRIRLLERRFGDGQPIREIAAEWRLPLQEVHNTYRKARREFYECLREVVAYHRPTATDVDRECRELLELLG